MDGLFTGPTGERRRFLDRLIPSFDPGYRTRLGQFERAMQHRNRLLAEDVRDLARFRGFEQVMAEAGVAIAAARIQTITELASALEERRHAPDGGAFPWAAIVLSGTLPASLRTLPDTVTPLSVPKSSCINAPAVTTNGLPDVGGHPGHNPRPCSRPFHVA